MKTFVKAFILITLALSPLFPQSDIISKSVEYLKNHGLTPAEYIVDKFKSRDIILLSEDHGVKENWELMHSIIPMLYKNGVYNIGMEFGASEDQQRLDSLTTAPAYNEQTARDLMFNYNAGWPFKEYIDIYKTVWEFNSKLKPGMKKFRIVNLSYKYDWSSFTGGMRTPANMKKVFYNGNTETYRFNVVEKEIINKKEKILIITGDIHAFTKYKYPVYDFIEKDFVRFENKYFGQLLYTKYPAKVYSILLHKPFRNYPDKEYFLVTPGNGLIEIIFEKLNNTPLGFDLVKTPLGNITDSSFYSMGYTDFTLSQIYDGYIFLKPVSKLNSCTIDTLFINGRNWQDIVNNSADPDWRKRPDTVDEYWQQIHEYSDIPKRYSYTR